MLCDVLPSQNLFLSPKIFAYVEVTTCKSNMSFTFKLFKILLIMISTPSCTLAVLTLFNATYFPNYLPPLKIPFANGFRTLGRYGRKKFGRSDLAQTTPSPFRSLDILTQKV